jgi:hypothetical protein
VTPEEDVQLRRERAYRKVLEANREKFMNALQLGDRDAAITGDVTFWRAWNGTAQHQASRSARTPRYGASNGSWGG